MAFDYINEAFKRLELIDEAMFDASTDGINSLAQYIDDDDNTDEIVRVIDPDATTEDDISDSYVGKVIINCNVCHSHIFNNKDDITIDDDGTVNAETPCPYCGESEGFVIVGEIAPYGDNSVSDNENNEEDTTSDLEDDDSQEEVVEESFNMSRASRRVVSETFKPSKGERVVDSNNKETLVNNQNGYQVFSNNNVFVGTIDAEDDDDAKDKWKLRKFEESLKEDFKEVSIKTDDQHLEMTSDENGKVTVVTEPIAAVASGEETIVPVSDETTNDILTSNEISSEAEVSTEDTSIEEPAAEESSKPSNEEPANEEPSNEDSEAESEDETFGESLEREQENDFDDVDEEKLDYLSETYLKSVYDNISSYKTENISCTPTQMIVEGVITFKSGASKRTGFIFEAKDMNARGQVRFIGTNKHLTESKTAFTLVGAIDNKKLISESLKYHYSVNEHPIRGIVRRK